MVETAPNNWPLLCLVSWRPAAANTCCAAGSCNLFCNLLAFASVCIGTLFCSDSFPFSLAAGSLAHINSSRSPGGSGAPPIQKIGSLQQHTGTPGAAKTGNPQRASLTADQSNELRDFAAVSCGFERHGMLGGAIALVTR